MTDIQPIPPTSPFEAIRREDADGEHWFARELMPLLEYHKWQDFKETIDRAIEDCVRSGRDVSEHFKIFTRARKNPEQAGRPSSDYRLTRYACHLIVMTARTGGNIAAHARTYFSDTIIQAETAENLDQAYLDWCARTISSFIAHGYSAEWAERRVDDITVRNALTHEWVVRGITPKEIPILTDELHMGIFSVSIQDHKGVKDFEIIRKGKEIGV